MYRINRTASTVPHVPHVLPVPQELCSATLGQAYRALALHHPATRHPLPDIVLAAVCDMTRGIAYLHGLNVVHGDMWVTHGDAWCYMLRASAWSPCSAAPTPYPPQSWP